MDLSAQTVLITGGASGIGLALAQRWLQRGSRVIVCGRRHAMLRRVQDAHPGIYVRVCDVAIESERRALVAWATAEFPRLDVLVNNAGIQRRIQIADDEEWERSETTRLGRYARRLWDGLLDHEEVTDQ